MLGLEMLTRKQRLKLGQYPADRFIETNFILYIDHNCFHISDFVERL